AIAVVSALAPAAAPAAPLSRVRRFTPDDPCWCFLDIVAPFTVRHRPANRSRAPARDARCSCLFATETRCHDMPATAQCRYQTLLQFSGRVRGRNPDQAR